MSPRNCADLLFGDSPAPPIDVFSMFAYQIHELIQSLVKKVMESVGFLSEVLLDNCDLAQTNSPPPGNKQSPPQCLSDKGRLSPRYGDGFSA